MRGKHKRREARSGFSESSPLMKNIDRAVERSAELIALDDALEGVGRLRPAKSGEWWNSAISAASQ
jgi:hypothetical protein